MTHDTNDTEKAKAFILDQDYGDILEDISDLPITAIKRLAKTTYFRVCNKEGYSKIPMLSMDDPRGMGDKMSIIIPDVVPQLHELSDQIKTSWAHLTITRSGEKHILLTTAITELTKDSNMLLNRARILEKAKTTWLRMTWDKSARMHRAVTPKFKIPDPDWGELPPMVDLLMDAFEGSFIESADNELVQYLLGGQ